MWKFIISSLLVLIFITSLDAQYRRPAQVYRPPTTVYRNTYIQPNIYYNNLYRSNYYGIVAPYYYYNPYNYYVPEPPNRVFYNFNNPADVQRYYQDLYQYNLWRYGQ